MRIILAVGLGAVLAAAAWAQGPNLLDNPGFEEAPPEGDESPALGWIAAAGTRQGTAAGADPATCLAVRDQHEPHSGEWCLRLQAEDRQLMDLRAQPERENGTRTPFIPVSGGERYDFSYWARVIEPGTILVGHLIFYDAEKQYLEGSHERLKTYAAQTGDRWLKFERSVPIEERAAFVIVEFAVGWGAGARQIAWLDDIELRPHQ